MGELDGVKPKRSNVRDILWAITLIAVGCITNNFVLELIISKKKNPHADPSAGSLMTFLQFIFVASLSSPSGFAWRGFGCGRKYGGSDGLLGCLRGMLPFKTRTLVVPFKHYIGMTVLFFTMSYLNNAAFAFHISQPLHMVFRSSSLMVTYAMGRAFFNKRCVRHCCWDFRIFGYCERSDLFAVDLRVWKANFIVSATSASQRQPHAKPCDDARPRASERPALALNGLH